MYTSQRGRLVCVNVRDVNRKKTTRISTRHSGGVEVATTHIVAPLIERIQKPHVSVFMLGRN